MLSRMPLPDLNVGMAIPRHSLLLANVVLGASLLLSLRLTDLPYSEECISPLATIGWKINEINNQDKSTGCNSAKTSVQYYIWATEM